MSLHSDVGFGIALELDYDGILALSYTNKDYYNKIFANNFFWQQKIAKDFKNFEKLSNVDISLFDGDYRKLYVHLYNSQTTKHHIREINMTGTIRYVPLKMNAMNYIQIETDYSYGSFYMLDYDGTLNIVTFYQGPQLITGIPSTQLVPDGFRNKFMKTLRLLSTHKFVSDYYTYQIIPDNAIPSDIKNAFDFPGYSVAMMKIIPSNPSYKLKHIYVNNGHNSCLYGITKVGDLLLFYEHAHLFTSMIDKIGKGGKVIFETPASFNDPNGLIMCMIRFSDPVIKLNSLVDVRVDNELYREIGPKIFMIIIGRKIYYIRRPGCPGYPGYGSDVLSEFMTIPKNIDINRINLIDNAIGIWTGNTVYLYSYPYYDPERVGASPSILKIKNKSTIKDVSVIPKSLDFIIKDDGIHIYMTEEEKFIEKFDNYEIVHGLGIQNRVTIIGDNIYNISSDEISKVYKYEGGDNNLFYVLKSLGKIFNVEAIALWGNIKYNTRPEIQY